MGLTSPTCPLTPTCSKHQLCHAGSRAGYPLPQMPCIESSLQAQLEALDCAQKQITEILQLFSYRAQVLLQLLAGQALHNYEAALSGEGSPIQPVIEGMAQQGIAIQETADTRQEARNLLWDKARCYRLVNTPENRQKATQLLAGDRQLLQDLHDRSDRHYNEGVGA